MKRSEARDSKRRLRWAAAILLAGLIALAAALVTVPGLLSTAADLVSNLVEPIFGLGFLTYVGISILSAPLERLLFFCAVLLALLVITLAVPAVLGALAARGKGRAGPRWIFCGRVAAVWLFLAVLFLFFRPIDPRYAAIVWDNALALVPAHLIAFGYAVLLYLVPKLLAALFESGPARRRAGTAVIVVLTAGVAAIVPHGERLLRASLLVVPEPAVRQLPTGGAENLSGIHLDPVHDRVLVAGHGTEHFLVYELGDLAAGPRLSAAETSSAQNFALNPARNEAYVYHHDTKELLVVDTASLAVKARIPGVDLAPGDPVLAWDDTGRVIIASEGPRVLTETVEDAFVVADLKAGAVVARHAEYLGEGLYYEPRRRLFYGTYFRGKQEILVYDPGLDRFTKRAPMPSKRMTMIGADPTRGELLVAFPLASKFLRIDPDTLEIKGEIRAMLGARRFALDLKRQVLVSLSLLASLSVIDLETGETLAHYRLPQPWLRNMAIDSERGKAYVTGRHGFYEVDYALRLPK